jgi:hypothetical protein
VRDGDGRCVRAHPSRSARLLTLSPAHFFTLRSRPQARHLAESGPHARLHVHLPVHPPARGQSRHLLLPVPLPLRAAGRGESTGGGRTGVRRDRSQGGGGGGRSDGGGGEGRRTGGGGRQRSDHRDEIRAGESANSSVPQHRNRALCVLLFVVLTSLLCFSLSVDALWSAMSACAALNPDVDEEDEDGEAGDFLFDSSEITAGLAAMRPSGGAGGENRMNVDEGEGVEEGGENVEDYGGEDDDGRYEDAEEEEAEEEEVQPQSNSRRPAASRPDDAAQVQQQLASAAAQVQAASSEAKSPAAAKKREREEEEQPAGDAKPAIK